MRIPRFEARVERWTGHGEGGRTVSVRASYMVGDIWEASEDDIAEATAQARELNRMLEEKGL